MKHRAYNFAKKEWKSLKTTAKQSPLKLAGNILEIAAAFVPGGMFVSMGIAAAGGALTMVSTHNRVKSGVLSRNQGIRSYFADAGFAALSVGGSMDVGKLGEKLGVKGAKAAAGISSKAAKAAADDPFRGWDAVNISKDTRASQNISMYSSREGAAAGYKQGVEGLKIMEKRTDAEVLLPEYYEDSVNDMVKQLRDRRAEMRTNLALNPNHPMADQWRGLITASEDAEYDMNYASRDMIQPKRQQLQLDRVKTFNPFYEEAFPEDHHFLQMREIIQWIGEEDFGRVDYKMVEYYRNAYIKNIRNAADVERGAIAGIFNATEADELMKALPGIARAA